MNVESAPLNPLTLADLRRLGPLQRLHKFILFSEVDSTNKYLLDHAAELPDGVVAAAEHQTAGRGRLGRSWSAATGSSILLSVLVHVAEDSALLANATTLAVVAAVEAVEAESSVRPHIRWPNDLCCGARKLAGVLAQSATLWCGGPRALVIGVGLNVLQRPADFPGELAEKATSLAIESPAPVSRAAIAGRLVARLDRWLSAAAGQDGSWANLRAAWLSRCRDIDARVTLSQDGQRYVGRVVEIHADGDLLVELDSGERKRFGAATTTRSW